MAKKTNNQPEGEGVKRPSDGFLISKIMVHPSRKIGLPKFSSVEVSAGMEVVFDTPQPVDSLIITEAFDKIRAVLKSEFTKQREVFGIKKSADSQES